MSRKVFAVIIVFLSFLATYRDVQGDLNLNNDALNFVPPSLSTQILNHSFLSILGGGTMLVFSILLLFLFNFFSSYFDKEHKEYSFENDKGLSLGLMGLLTFISWKFGFFLFWLF